MKYTVKSKVNKSAPYCIIHEGTNRKEAIAAARYEAYHGLYQHDGGRVIVIDNENPFEYLFMYEESHGGWGYTTRNGVQHNVRL